MVAAALSSAGLRPPEALFLRYPHELSGGQRQRVLIAGALALQPQLLIADEPVSSLDASIRGEILALLLKLREELGLGVLVVTHDLGLAWNIADRIAVMYLGRVVEAGPTEEVLTAPQHPYTQALLSVVPEMEGLEPIVLRGEIPDPTRIPSGCRFHPRCPALASGEADAVADLCRGTSLPILPSDPDGHRSACHLVAARTEATAMTLQAALPRELYVDAESFAARARTRAAARVDVRRTRGGPRPGPARAGGRGRRARRVRRGHRRRRRRAARVVQRVPAPRLAALPDRAGQRAAAVRRAVDPLPLPLVDLRPRRLAAARSAHRGRRRRAGGVRAAPRRGRVAGAASSSCTRRPTPPAR